MRELWDLNKAAAYCGVPLAWFTNVTKVGTGPNFIKPTPRKIMFRQEDLDAWIASWANVAASQRRIDRNRTPRRPVAATNQRHPGRSDKPKAIAGMNG